MARLERDLSDDHKTLLRLSGRASSSQILQDVFVLSQTGFKRKGFFVEFGALDGIDTSNSYLLETAFDWTGILAEPAKLHHDALRQNRKASLCTKCVWRESGLSLEFLQADLSGLSTIAEFKEHDQHAARREKSSTYLVETISLVDLLKEHNAPKQIDYLSIDTEGSEFEILSAFDFSAYEIRVITCEHNHTENREKIYDLLTRHGYQRVYEEVSDFDDWYFLKR